MTAPASDRHLHELDYIRGWGAVAVVVYHLTYRGWTRDDLADVAYPEVTGFAPYLTIALPGFFMISGFLMFHTTVGRSPRQFLTARIARLYPTFWAAVLITAVATLVLSDGRFTVTPVQVMANLTMVSTYLGQPFVDGVYWSLVVELKLYFWVLVLLATGLVRHLDAALAGWLGVSVLAAVGVGHPLVDEALETEFSCYFVVGATAHLIRRRGWTPGRVGLLAGSAAVACFRLPDRIPDGSGTVTIVVVLALMVFVVAAALDRFTWLPAGGLTAALATISYPLYLLHERIGYQIINRLAHWNRWWLLAVTASVVVGLAAVVHVVVEKPGSPALRRWLDRLVPRHLPRRRTPSVVVDLEDLEPLVEHHQGDHDGHLHQDRHHGEQSPSTEAGTSGPRDRPPQPG